MKQIITILMFLAIIIPMAAQPTQSGYVKTKGRMDSKGQLIPGTRIGGAAITLAGGHSTVADANGNFKLTVPDKKYYLQNVQKQGYVLVDPDVLSKQYVQSVNPLVITMETPEKQLEDQLKSERKLRRTLQQQLQQREDEIESLKENNIITAEEYRAALQKLYADQESNEKLISDMAKRYAEVDYDLLDEFYRQVTFCIENGDLMKADSLLRLRGDVVQQAKDVHNKAQAINEEKEKIRQAETVLAADIEELARRCYSYCERFYRVNSDSAFLYIACRADLDTTNYEWQMDVFHKTFRSKKTLPYVLRALRIALTQYGEFHPVVAETYISISKCDEDDKEIFWLDKAFEIYNFRADLEKIAEMYQLYGWAYRLYDDNKALAYYNKALETFKQMLIDSVDKKNKLYEAIWDVYKDIGDVYKSKEKYIKAIQYYLMADSLNVERERIDSETNCRSLYELYDAMGNCYVEMEKYDQAVKCYQRILSLNCIREETRYYI
jgi:tetratricopeptide (TPR) repeat protein